MSKLIVTITKIQTNESLNIVSFDCNGTSLKMMSLDLAQSVKVGANVSLNIKASSVALAKNLSGDLSYSNKINAKIVSIENGALLTSIKLSVNQGFIESIITRESSDRMDLQVGDEVIALLKASELSIAEVLS